MAPATAPIISAGLPAPMKETRSPSREPMPAPITATIIRFAMILLLGRIAGDVDLFAGLDQFEAVTDFQFLLRGIIRQTLDVLAHALDLAIKLGIAPLHFFDLTLTFQ
jgi:hypothetical protein